MCSRVEIYLKGYKQQDEYKEGIQRENETPPRTWGRSLRSQFRVSSVSIITDHEHTTAPKNQLLKNMGFSGINLGCL